MISASKALANFSASSKAVFANSDPSNGTKIFLYIPHLPQEIIIGMVEEWNKGCPVFQHSIIPVF
jgi:hypothetical protein